MRDIAKRGDQETSPMPEIHSTVLIDRRYSGDEFSRLRAGRISHSMDDKLFVYHEKPWLYLHRSWTSVCCHMVRIEPDGEDFVCNSVRINRDPSQHCCPDTDDREVQLVCWILDGQAGLRDHRSPVDDIDFLL